MKWTLLGEFLEPFSPKYGSSLPKFQLVVVPVVVYHKTKRLFEHSFKIKCLNVSGRYPKFTILVHFWAQFASRKPKILPKTKIFSETTPLWLSNNASRWSQINHWILIKLMKKLPFFWAKNRLFKIKNRLVNKYQEVRGQVNTTFSEVPNSWLTVDKKCFVVVRLKLALFQFQCQSFLL